MKAVALVSGGIDSPVAAALAGRKYNVIAVHFCLYPFYCTGSFKSVMSALKKLSELREHIIIVPWSAVLSKIVRHEKHYQCILCRAGMLRAAQVIARKEGAKFIVTGEAIGQKASQTLPNIAATSAGINLPVLRPLIGLDKEDIIELSKQFGLWSEKHAGCCSATPSRPVLHAEKRRLETLWSSLELEKMIELSVKRMMKLDRKTLSGEWSDILKRL